MHNLLRNEDLKGIFSTGKSAGKCLVLKVKMEGTGGKFEKKWAIYGGHIHFSLKKRNLFIFFNLILILIRKFVKKAFFFHFSGNIKKKNIFEKYENDFL